MKRERLTCLLSTFPPLSAHLAALWVKRTNPAVWWVADFRDPLLGNPVAAKGATRWNRRIEKAIFKWADVLIANTDAVAERWRAEYPDYRNKIAYIWNGFDPEEAIVPLAIPPRGYRQLAHVGEIYGGRHPGQLLDSIKRLSRSLSRSNPFRLELIGSIDRKTVPNADILTMLEQDNWVVVKPTPLPPSDAAKVMAQADALVLIDWADHSAGLQVPSKLYVYLRIGRPILAITTRDSPTDRILRQSGVPFICLYPDDPHTEVDAKVLSFLALSNEPHQPSTWFYEHFDGQRQVATLAGLLCARDQA